MSRVRGVDPALRARYQPGRCRWCEGPVEPPRRTFCSNPCIHEWKLRSNAGYRRAQVFARDAGICAECGRDCRALERELLRMLYAEPSRIDGELARLGLTRLSYGGDLDRRLLPHQRGRLGHAVDPSLRIWDPDRSLWEADHIVAVVQGGGSCGLSNLQTLCTWCHARKTARLAAERAAVRRSIAIPDDFYESAPPIPADLFDDE